MSNIGAIVGGSSSNGNNSPWFNSDVIGPGDNQLNNGLFLDASGSVAVTDNGSSKVRATSAGDFSNTIVGPYANINFDPGSDYTSGFYEVIAVDASNNYVDLELAYIDDDAVNITIVVGGAVPIIDVDYDLQDVLDDALSSAASNDVVIYILGTGEITATLDIDTGGGSATTTKTLVGTNTSYVIDGTRAKITTATSLINGLVHIANGVSGITFRNIDFDAGGVGKADYCILNNTDAEESIVFKNCLMHDSDIDGIHHGGSAIQDEWAVLGCEVYDNRGSGIRARSSARGVIYIIGCSIHDNSVYGIFIGEYVRAYNNRVYANGDSGIYNSAATVLFARAIISNTMFGNGGDGFESVASSGLIVIANNTSVANVGFGYNLAGMAIGEVMVFSNNHSKDNDAEGTPDSPNSHCSETSTLALFQGFGQGNNISGDPLFTNVSPGSENFIPTSNSPLIDAAVGGTGDTVGALCATAGEGGAVWPQNIERHGD